MRVSFSYRKSNLLVTHRPDRGHYVCKFFKLHLLFLAGQTCPSLGEKKAVLREGGVHLRVRARVKFPRKFELCVHDGRGWPANPYRLHLLLSKGFEGNPLFLSIHNHLWGSSSMGCVYTAPGARPEYSQPPLQGVASLDA
jgi:hypothetical protein